MPLTIYRRQPGGNWHYRGSINKRKLRGSCRTKDKATAKRLVAQIEKRVWDGHFDGPTATLTFAQAAMLYRAAEKHDKFLERVEDYWKNTLVSTIKPEVIRQAAIEVFPTQGPATRNRQMIIPTQSVINFAAQKELCPRIMTPRFRVPKIERDYATWGWVERFMQHAAPHMSALCCFMFLTAARISEARSLTWADVNLQDATARIRETKVQKQRIAHLPPELVAAMANIPSNRNPDSHVFGYSGNYNPRQVWNNVIKRAGLPHLSFHACRHGFATGMLRAGVDPVTVAEKGGWADTSQLFKTYGHARTRKNLTNVLTQAQNGHNTPINEDDTPLTSDSYRENG